MLRRAKHLKSRIKELFRKESAAELGQPHAQAQDAPERAIPSLLAKRDLWLEAFEKLPKDTQRQLQRDNATQGPHNQQIQELLNLVKKKQEECERKFWRLRVGDHEIVLRDYAVTIVGCLQKIGDIAIQFAPPQASIPWSAVKALLQKEVQITVTESAQMCALLASADRIVRVINRGQIYELVYTTETTPELALNNLQAALIDLYSAALELLANSTKLLDKSTITRTLHSILHSGETADLFSNLVKHESELAREAQACESRRSADADTSLMRLLRELEVPLTRVDEKVSSLLERVDDSERLAILEWISAVPYRKHHDTVKEARTRGTCQWLLQHQRFREWANASFSVIMWLQGSPGAGKTFLTSAVIDHVEGILSTAPNHEGFAFFYCNRHETDRREPLSVLRSYVRQLSTTAFNPESMRAKLRSLCQETRLKGAHLTLATCQDQLLESVNLYPQTTLVLDALDECEPETRARLIDTIEFLLKNSERPLKVFISSRPDVDIRDRLLSQPNIEIRATDNQDDIAKFVNEEIIKHRRWGKIAAPLRTRIVDTLLDRSQGMFQWASLQIKQLLELQTQAAITDRLGKLPIDLEAAYDEIYGKIAARNEHDKAIADRAFMWVMCANPPLRSADLLSAIRLDPENDAVQFSDDELDENLLADICNNLLVLDSQRRVWRFSHLSVAEYFEKNHWSLRQAHCHAAAACLMLLMMNKVDSSGYWSGRREGDNLLTLAAVGGHKPIIEALLRRGMKLNTPLNNKWGSALATVVAHGSLEIVQFLVEKGADVNMPLHTGDYGSALAAAASYSGDIKTIEFLLEKGADVNMPLPTGDYGSALAAAACSAGTDVVRFLVEKGADVNMPLQIGNYGSALAAAVCNGIFGEIKTVEFLVEKGADINMPLPIGYFGSALAAAACSGYTEVVRFLVEKGADVNMPLQTGRYGSALAAAACEGYPKVVGLLLEKGADVNMPLQAGPYGSALEAAADKGQAACVEILVEAGARQTYGLNTRTDKVREYAPVA
ncbi:155b9fce-3d70-4eae-8d87-6b345046ed02 [Thermothielavioides terrestris]|uniref:155b9fce-3d70-4eae-8d87-6b345046ed02 n=1 Tax=Thermothielavioides terrestris TaxID=2587410 RepID=A0A446BVB0_9PEZI|nr:155b9fce-3d70-4eae-8d87-6b345046ed02 [Thermothielavioides terrestris]